MTAWKIDGLGLFWPESIYLIDPPELKPVGFVWMGCPPHRKSLLALGRRSEVSNLGSQFFTAICTSSSGFSQSWIGRSYSEISFVFLNIPAFLEPRTLVRGHQPKIRKISLTRYRLFVKARFWPKTPCAIASLLGPPKTASPRVRALRPGSRFDSAHRP